LYTLAYNLAVHQCMLEDKNMKERHLHFDIENLDHTDLDSKDLCFLAEEYLVLELQYTSIFFQMSNSEKTIKM